MATEVQDDYLGCDAYKAHTSNKSATYPGFITFTEGSDHFFAWVNGNEIVMRSEAYPDADKMERGIKAILKNWDLPERYAVVEGEGGHLLLMYGGGDHQKHTGNFEKHSEIGRSCAHPNKETLNALLAGPKGQDFADKVIPIERAASAASMAAAAAVAAAPVAAVATGVAAAAAAVGSMASSTTSNVSDKSAAATSYASDTVEAAAGSSLGWLKWLLIPLLLLGAYLIWSKGCKGNGGDVPPPTGDTPYLPKKSDTNIVVMPTKESMMVKLADGVEINAYKGGIEDQLVAFLNSKDVVDTANKKANWYTFNDLNFVFGKNALTDSSKKQIGNLVAVMKAYPNFRFKIGAYTDKKGDDASNMKLSQGRAETVQAAIKTAGGDITHITKAEGYGESLAEIAETASDAERLKDRRTAIRVVAK